MAPVFPDLTKARRKSSSMRTISFFFFFTLYGSAVDFPCHLAYRIITFDYHFLRSKIDSLENAKNDIFPEISKFDNTIMQETHLYYIILNWIAESVETEGITVRDFLSELSRYYGRRHFLLFQLEGGRFCLRFSWFMKSRPRRTLQIYCNGNMDLCECAPDEIKTRYANACGAFCQSPRAKKR